MASKSEYSEFRCARTGCNRRLKKDHYVYSSFTGNRYCWPGEGHNRPKKGKS